MSDKPKPKLGNMSASQVEAIRERLERLFRQPEQECALAAAQEEFQRQLNAYKELYEPIGKELAAEREKVEQLEAWKESMLAVEATWEEQEVGRLLGLTLGQPIRANIAEGIQQLREQLATEREAWQKHFDALADENQRLREQVAMNEGIEDELREANQQYYDCKVQQQPLVDALNKTSYYFELMDKSDNFLGDDAHVAWTAVHAALTKLGVKP